jgi:predicted dehydrogenase
MFTVDPRERRGERRGERRAAVLAVPSAIGSAQAVRDRARGEVRVLTGRIGPDAATELTAFVRDGGCVLMAPEPGDAVAADLAGLRVSAELPHAEWFVTLAERPEAARLEREVPVSSRLRTLEVAAPDTTVVATTSVRFQHLTTMTVRTLGEGRIVSSGVADLDALQAHGTLGRFVARLLRPTPAADSRTLGVGIVGYGPFGGMGYMHGLASTETDGLQLVAAADSAVDRIAAARVDFPDLNAHDSATSLAADAAVDIAVIATPPKFHAELALELLRAGKHVVLEKPMCLQRDDADRIIATAHEHGRTVTVHQSRRWDTDFLAVRRLVDAGVLGDVFNIETFVGGFDHPCRAWHSEESVSGGAVYDWGSHHVDWITLLHGGAPSRVLCTTHSRVWQDTTNVDQLSLWMQWDDGREATFRQSDVCAIRRPKFHIQGTVGTLEGHYRPLRTETVVAGRGYVEHTSHHAEAPVDLRVVRYDGDHGTVESTVRPAPHPGWAFHRNLADHLLLGEQLAVPPEESRDVVAVLEAAQRSGAQGGALIEL